MCRDNFAPPKRALPWGYVPVSVCSDHPNLWVETYRQYIHRLDKELPVVLYTLKKMVPSHRAVVYPRKNEPKQTKKPHEFRRPGSWCFLAASRLRKLRWLEREAGGEGGQRRSTVDPPCKLETISDCGSGTMKGWHANIISAVGMRMEKQEGYPCIVLL